MSAAVTSTESHHALPVGQRLGEFEVRAVIGVGGFGIVYHAFDHALERDVAIKEYMPGALASRSATLHVSVLSQGHAETFALGLKSFVNEARLLARFDHPSLVKVHRFWEAHSTAYMVMPLYRGRTLKALRQARTDSPDEAWLRGLVAPLLGALETLHAEGVYHRDIAPDNILVADDGRPVLLDFGAARRVIGDRSQTLTAILKPSYAPIEQYAEAEGLRQGPWTDLYAMGATLHFVITGQAPQPATARALGTDHHLLASHPRRGVSVEFLRIVDWMMAPRPEHRPQGVAALREVLEGRTAAPVPPPPVPAAASPQAWERTAIQSAPTADTARTAISSAPTVLQARPTVAPRPAPPRAAPARKTTTRWGVAAVATVITGVALAAWMKSTPGHDARSPSVAGVAPAPAVSPETPAAPPSSSAPAAVPGPTTAEAPSSAAAAVLLVQDATPAAAIAPAASATIQAKPPIAPTAQRTHRPIPRPAPEPETVEVAAAAPAAAEPVPAPEPAPALSSPGQQCKGRVLMALYRCVKRACEDPSFTNHRDCRRVRQIEAANSQRVDH